MSNNLTERAKELNLFYAERHKDEKSDSARPCAVNTVAHICKRCGWEWRTYEGITPRACPSCRARKWQTPKTPRVSDTKRKCLHCGYEWSARKEKRPCACPACAAKNWDKPPLFRHGANVQKVEE